ncbi:DUF3169 family protein [Staphylococcus sp. GDY8P57P]|uniref:DUF3169 family protein n=1 Tax=Staphylococcus sp. GDY8P57P TaxID=2804128 RepID=UPI001880FF90|nr:DUF3169 family protein [Staphylococcus sp. GDY8P57P]MBF2756560.1 DUF3169 family protein [Staphylococcus haemolyticus]MBF2773808.1 DUF3169 family protein [Staphylococcus haemolyticus]MBF2775924.1 DUF3169 family protein [Staphylococcus haemolyticus]MBF2815493.1 DUF3169 family protein [Staphylococcus haemolyticus]MBF9719733.1 DUF3169 family protein [Staphylococcus haemolyticus]
MKVRRNLLLLVLGGLIGGIVGGSMGSISNFLSNINLSHTHFGILICIISSLLIIGLTVYLWKVQKDAIKFKTSSLNSIEDDEADIYEKKANLNSIKSSIITYIQLIISFIALLLIVFGHGSNIDVLYATIPYLLSIIPLMMTGFFNRRFDSRYPKIGEKKATEKTLALMDDGERHITLVSMYKNYQVNLALLMIAIIFLGIFSIDTGSNQTLGILFLIIIFAYNSLGYMLKVRKFYKS